MMDEAYDKWHELEAETGTNLFQYVNSNSLFYGLTLNHSYEQNKSVAFFILLTLDAVCRSCNFALNVYHGA